MFRKRKYHEIDENGEMCIEEEEENRQIQKAIKLSLRRSFDGEGFYLNDLSNHYPSYYRTVKIESIFDIDNLKSLYISAFVFDLEFLKNLVQKKIPITITRHWRTGSNEKEGKYIIEDDKNLICFCHPKLLSSGVVHCKLWLLQFNEYLRVVVTTGNFTYVDWFEMIQTVWIQDFPLKNFRESKEFCEFEEILKPFFTTATCGLSSKWLEAYDFSGAKVHLIPSIPGYYIMDNNATCCYGHRRLRNLLDQYPIITSDSSKKSSESVFYNNHVNFNSIETIGIAQATSLGNLSPKFIEEISESMHISNPSENLYIIYPSVSDAEASKLGLQGAGHCFLLPAHFASKTFPKPLMNHFDSLRNHSYLPHCKTYMNIIVNWSTGKLTMWIVTGSHNLSAAAWGKLESNQRQFGIMNYELSVFFPPITIDIPMEFWKNNHRKEITNEMIPNTFPLPFKLPLRKYGNFTNPILTKF